MDVWHAALIVGRSRDRGRICVGPEIGRLWECLEGECKSHCLLSKHSLLFVSRHTSSFALEGHLLYLVPLVRIQIFSRAMVKETHSTGRSRSASPSVVGSTTAAAGGRIVGEGPQFSRKPSAVAMDEMAGIGDSDDESVVRRRVGGILGDGSDSDSDNDESGAGSFYWMAPERFRHMTDVFTLLDPVVSDGAEVGGETKEGRAGSGDAEHGAGSGGGGGVGVGESRRGRRGKTRRRSGKRSPNNLCATGAHRAGSPNAKHKHKLPSTDVYSFGRCPCLRVGIDTLY